MAKILNKLVRDNITQIIENENKKCLVRILNSDEFLVAINNKLKEEVEEFFVADNKKKRLEELADILEVIRSLAQIEGSTYEDLEIIRLKKKKTNGSFSKQVFLEKIY